MKEIIVLAADHAGFALKEKIKLWLKNEKSESSKHEVVDSSPNLIQGDDYPDQAFKAAKEVRRRKARGVFICGTGEGMCMAANKVKGIRAGLGYDLKSARLIREHNDSNVLCLGGRILKEALAKAIVKAWLSASYQGGRHDRRIQKISRHEKFRFH
ncbi:ribose 5-phosphate isomerase B [Candidatus Woesearchaeota archaeon]|nr:ribose 5-phosphate isomerase B [Candidatus Woesearchaeota archaeon]